VPRLVDDNFVVLITMIETRGEGGQFLAAPSPGYELLQGDFPAIPEITGQERQLLISAAISLNEYVEREKVEGLKPRPSAGTRLPGDDFNERGNVSEILRKHAWVAVRHNGVYEHWRRPGKDRGVSASLINERFFKVFSTNALPLEAEKVYSPLAIFALLEHGGDYATAARELSQQGYGDKTARASGGEAAWPDPEPLRRPIEPPQPFPVEVLGGVLELLR
jgi:hypothetical protein